MAINRSVTNQQTFLKRKGWPQFSACCQREKGKMTEMNLKYPPNGHLRLGALGQGLVFFLVITVTIEVASDLN